MVWRSGLALGASLVLAGQAWAQPIPRLVPVRDVTVHYQVTPAGHGPVDVLVAIEAGGARLRITSPALPTTIVVDRPAGTAAVMLPLLRAYSTVKIGRYDPEPTVLHGATFSRGARERIAGRDCVVWHAVSADGAAQACITGDGVILRGSAISNKRGLVGEIAATRVMFGPVPRSDFSVPPDYQPSPFRLDPAGPSLKGFSLKTLRGGVDQ